MSTVSAGSHVPVLLNEAVAGLQVRAGGVYVDGTFGRGGHSRAVLAQLSAQGRLIALDRDAVAVAAGREIRDARLEVVHARFSEMTTVLRERGIGKVDGILLDLGVSSPQFDDAARGFSFRFDAPLDMRMDTSRGISAAEWLANATEQEIREVIKDYGEERFARQIAAAIVKARSGNGVDTTRKLAAVVAQAVRTREPGQDPATRTFQALRIYINQELEELRQVLPQCVELLAPAGRLVVISFHSLEDRIVKQFMQTASKPPALPRRLPVRAADMPKPALRLIGRAVKPALKEVQRNPRARSAIMRVAEKAS